MSNIASSNNIISDEGQDSQTVKSQGKSLVKLSNICKSFVQGKEEIKILSNLNLELSSGKSLAVVGASGSGKSTLLQIIAGLQSFDSGELNFRGGGGENLQISQLSDFERTRLRALEVGFIYQYHHLLGNFTALENILLPMKIANTFTASKYNKAKAIDRAKYLLNSLGLGNRMNFLPSALSGGQQQRVAIARALANSPSLVIADEPTGNLDQENAETTMDLLLQMVKEEQKALIIATHSRNIAQKLDDEMTL